MSALHIDRSIFFELHPFSVTFDGSLRVLDFGDKASALIACLERGRLLSDAFELVRPISTFESLSKDMHRGALVIMTSKNGTVFRGQVSRISAEEDAFVFLCSPWLKSLSDLRAIGLSLADLPVYDSLADHLILLNAKDAALRDSETLQNELRKQMEERSELERRLAQSERLAAVGQLAAGVAHEINNPLAYVIGNLKYVSDAIAKVDLEHSPECSEIRDALVDTQDGAWRIQKIVQDLRLFSRADPEESTEHVRISHAIKTAMKLVRHEIEHRARLSSQIVGDPRIEASPSRFGQLIVNLLMNAAQAIPVGSSEANEVTVHAERVDDKVVVRVSDTGSGIPPDVQPRVFEPFYTTKRDLKGSGLGLSICHGIVQQMNGEIQIVETSASGTTFEVRLPAAGLARTVATRRRASTSGDRSTLRILIIDDDERVAKVLRRLLRAKDATIVDNAAVALDMGTELSHYDLVFCDLMMPEISGMEFHSRLSQIDAKVAQNVVFMTGGAFSDEANRFLAETPNRHIQKPFNRDELKQIVENAATNMA